MTIYKYLRLLTGLKQEEFANAIGVRNASLSQIELGNKQAWKAFVKPYSKYFKLKEYELLEMADKFSNKSKQAKMVSKINKFAIQTIKEG